jgi:hypothetical protein
MSYYLLVSLLAYLLAYLLVCHVVDCVAVTLRLQLFCHSVSLHFCLSG